MSKAICSGVHRNKLDAELDAIKLKRSLFFDSKSVRIKKVRGGWKVCGMHIADRRRKRRR